LSYRSEGIADFRLPIAD